MTVASRCRMGGLGRAKAAGTALAAVGMIVASGIGTALSEAGLNNGGLTFISASGKFCASGASVNPGASLRVGERGTSSKTRWAAALNAVAARKSTVRSRRFIPI